mgnify:CR=1 FL=1
MTTELSERAFGKQKADVPPSYETTQLITADFEYNSIKFPLTIYGSLSDPKFLIKDIEGLLQAKDIHKSIDSIDDEDKGWALIPTLGGMQKMRCVSEIGMYQIVMQSRKGELSKRLRKFAANLLKQKRLEYDYRLQNIEQKALEDKAAAEARCV